MKKTTYSKGEEQIDGRSYVTETFVFDDDTSAQLMYLADKDMDLDARLASDALHTEEQHNRELEEQAVRSVEERLTASIDLKKTDILRRLSDTELLLLGFTQEEIAYIKQP